MSKNIEIAVVGSNPVEDVLRVVPVIEYRLDLILLFIEPEPHRTFIGLSA
ncbi:MAG: hypothetical protein WCF26_17795 [Candidatus Sulfotelmatobacter sp.]